MLGREASGCVRSAGADISEEAQFSQRLSNLGRQSKWACALHELTAARPTHLKVSAYNAVVAACGNSQAWGLALGLVSASRHQQLRINSVTFGAALACQGSRWQRCVQLLSEAVQSCIEPLVRR